MDEPLGALEVWLLDCQTSGATPQLGALLSLSWARTNGRGATAATEERWLRLPPGTIVPRPVRRLLDWSDKLAETGVEPEAAWRELVAAAAASGPLPRPTAIHFAQFELRFLRDLHARFDPRGTFPFEVVCLHELAKRLLPELPRRGLRPLAGFLGDSPSQLRRGGAHADTSAFVWRALLPELERRGVVTFGALAELLAEPAPRSKRTFPLASERRRALPAAPGVYRFKRVSGDVLYVGKASDLKRRVSSHFTAGTKTTERALEMLTQARDLDFVVTATPLEAALHEVDEIKRLDPPYNVQLKDGAREVGWASRDFARSGEQRTRALPIGPLPSRRALAQLGALRELALGGPADDRRRAQALGVPPELAPPGPMFDAALGAVNARLPRRKDPSRALLATARALLPEREVLERASDDDEPSWDVARVERHLLRAILRGGQLVRRGPWLARLQDADIHYHEPGFPPRDLAVRAGRVLAGEARLDAPALALVPPDGAPPLTPADYDRVRVLLTELLRVHGEGGAIALRFVVRGVARAVEGRALDRLFALL